MAQDHVRVDWRQLKDFTRDLFVRVGLSPEGAELQADVLVWANLRGIDSHGVLAIPWYVEEIEAGNIRTNPNIRVLNETPATILIDGDRAPGPVVTAMAMKRVIEKAKELGIGWGLIRDTGHQGAMGYYTLMAAKENMAGIASVSGPPTMAPYGARASGLHNSPLSIAIPAKRHNPPILDMATSVAASGKINLARDKGEPIPLGWAIDKDGRPTTDPELGSVILPFGGPKGSGMALVFECLSSLMVGNALAAPILAGKREVVHIVQNSFVAALNIGMFTDVDTYKQDVDNLIDVQKTLSRAEGVEEILVPGEPEDRVRQERARHGIPLPEGTLSRLRPVAERLGVALPSGL